MDVWRLVLEKVATLEELKTSWTLDDVERAVAVLAFKASVEKDVEKIYTKRSKLNG